MAMARCNSMIDVLTTTYIGFAIFIYMATGCTLLLFDAKEFKKMKMNREKRAAQIAGWLNLTLCGLALVVKLIFM
jgi:hypothetical protein